MFAPVPAEARALPRRSTSRRCARWPSTSSATCARPSPASRASPSGAATPSTCPSIGIRTGDTPAARARAHGPPPARHPDHHARSRCSWCSPRRRARCWPSVETVIVDEIHALVGTKRGAHLALSLERLQEHAARGRCSASASPPPSARSRRSRATWAAASRAARWQRAPGVDRGRGRAQGLRPRVEVPVEDMSRLAAAAAEPATRRKGPRRRRAAQLDLARHPPAPAGADPRPPLDAHLREQPPAGRAAGGARSTSWRARSWRARTTARSPASSALEIEDALKAGPPARDGRHVVPRAGHRHGRHRPRGPDRDAALGGQRHAAHRPRRPPGGRRLARRHLPQVPRRPARHRRHHARHAATGAVEETRIPQNPLDVLAQQLVAICAGGGAARWTTSSPSSAAPRPSRGCPARSSRACSTCSRAATRPTSSPSCGRASSGTACAGRCARARARGAWRSPTPGTIPDRGLYGVFLADDGDARARPARGRAGAWASSTRRWSSRAARARSSCWAPRAGASSEIDARPRAGRARARRAGQDAVLEGRPRRAAGRAGPRRSASSRASCCRRDAGGRAAPAGRASTRSTRRPRREPARLPRTTRRQATGAAARRPHARAGAHARRDGRLAAVPALALGRPRARAVGAGARGAAARSAARPRWRRSGATTASSSACPTASARPTRPTLLPEPDEIEDLVVGELGGTALFAAHFREAAGRALLLPRRRPGQRSPLWMQRKRAARPAGGGRRATARSRSSSRPTASACRTSSTCPRFVELARRVQQPRGAAGHRGHRSRRRPSRPRCCSATSPTTSTTATRRWPSAAPRPCPSTRRSCASCWARPSCASCSTREALAELELRAAGPRRDAARAQRRPPARPAAAPGRPLARTRSRRRVDAPRAARGRRRAGELAGAGPRPSSRSAGSSRVTLAGEPRFAAAEDAGRLRDALGVPPPPGLPEAFLEPVPDALRELVARYARTHGPFTRRGRGAPLRHGRGARGGRAARAGRGGPRRWRASSAPAGHGREWCDADVLATLRRRSLARLRKQVEPAPSPRRSRACSLDWQGVATTARRRAARRARRAARRRRAAPGRGVPGVSALERDILPARLPGYRPQDLDLLCAAGEVVWVGVAPLGERDGRVALYLADDLRAAARAAARAARRASCTTRSARTSRGSGASFFAELHEAAGGGLAQAGARRAVGPRLGGRGHERHARGAARVPAAAVVARAPGAAPAAFRSRRHAPPARCGPLEPASRGRAARPRHRTERAEGARRAAARAPRRADPRGGAGRGRRRAASRRSIRCCKALEEAGRIRRGYFVAGLGGSQFAQPGALDRLRALRETAADPGATDAPPPAVVLAATDPANAVRRRAALAGRAIKAHARGGRPRRAGGRRARRVPAARRGRAGHACLPEDEPQRTQTARAVARALAAWAAADGPRHARLEEDGRRGRRRHRGRAARGGVRRLRAGAAVHGAIRRQRERAVPARTGTGTGTGTWTWTWTRTGMPEGDTILRAATRMHAALAGRTVTAFRSRLPALAMAARRQRVEGSVVSAVEARGKHLLVRFSTGAALHTHMGMTGSWHLYRAGSRWRKPEAMARVVIDAGDVIAVCFVAAAWSSCCRRAERPRIRRSPRLGPDVLAPARDAAPRGGRPARPRRATRSAPRSSTRRALSGVGNI